MDKKGCKNELDVDFIGGEELTEKEKDSLKDFFAKKKKQKGRVLSTRKSKDREKIK
ncbi:MAG: hypothetical protein WA960_00185 [Tunicatimonas sp.]